jgi:geranylgeranyl pyrophosphate synthase
VANDTQREQEKTRIITEINRIKQTKLAAVQQIITNAQTIKDKAPATKEELEKALNDLKILANAPANSAQSVV